MNNPFNRLLFTWALVGLCSLLAASTQAAEFDRINAWKAVEAYKFNEKEFNKTYAKWLHETGNENKSKQEAKTELGIEEPDPTPALKAALQIAKANPTDDLGFMAIMFCSYAWQSEDGRKTWLLPALELLDAHYLHDTRLAKMILGLARRGGKEGIAFLDKVVAQSDKRVLRARAAYWSAAERLMRINDITVPQAERMAIRSDITRLAKLVAAEYGDEQIHGAPARDQAKPLLYAIEHLSLGSVLPNATANRIDGSEDQLINYRGKVLLIDFWATWCVPCVASLPKVVKLKQELADQPFEVITISIDDSVDEVLEFMEDRMELPFINWHIGDQSELYKAWNIKGVPTYFLVDQEGVIHGKTYDVESLVDLTKQLTSSLATTL